jgi:hypothetical protein
VVVIVGIVVYYLIKAAFSSGEKPHYESAQFDDSAAPAPVPKAVDPPLVAEVVAALHADDPDFEAETFLQRAEMTYFFVNRAYQRRDAPAMQPYLAPEVFDERAQAVQSLLAEHQKPAQIDLNVCGMQVPSVVHGTANDRIVVHFDLVSRERMLADRTGKPFVAGDDRRSGETWVFSRKAGTKTLVSGGRRRSEVSELRCSARARRNRPLQALQCRRDDGRAQLDRHEHRAERLRRNECGRVPRLAALIAGCRFFGDCRL